MSTNTGELFNAYFGTLQDNVRKHCNVVKNSQGTAMLRLDQEVPENFYPRFSENVGAKEDRTVPRICVAPSILACLLGYWRSVQEILERPVVGFKNGYVISALSWEYAFRPGAELAADAPLTDEHWLLGYSPNTRLYAPKAVGQLFIHTLVIRPTPEQGVNRMVIQLLVHVQTSDGLMLDREQRLEEGYYRVTVDVTRMSVAAESKVKRLGMQDLDEVAVEKISQDVYSHARSTSASLEGQAASRPKFLKW